MNVHLAHSMQNPLQTIDLPRSGLRAPTAALAGVVGVTVAVTATAAGAMPWALAWLLVGAPLAEEVIFRRGLQETLLRRLPGSRHGWANLLTGLVFAGAHVVVRPGWTAAATLLPALALGLLYGRTRRLLPCVFWHALFNLAGAVWFGSRSIP